MSEKKLLPKSGILFCCQNIAVKWEGEKGRNKYNLIDKTKFSPQSNRTDQFLFCLLVNTWGAVKRNHCI